MNQKPYNLLSYQKSVEFLTFVSQNVEKFCSSISRDRSYFSKFLPYAPSQFNKYMNSNDDTKNLKATDIIHIFDNLSKKYQYEILEWFGANYDFTIIDNEKEKTNKDSLETLLLKLTSTNGNLSTNFLEAVEDGIISNDEKEKLQSIAIQFRSLLRTFENRIGQCND